MHRRPVLRALAGVATAAAVATGALAGPAPVAAAPAAAPTASIYDQPASFDGTHSGQILQSKRVTLQQLGLPLPYQAWQVQYVTQDTAGAPQADVATVVKPLVSNKKQLLSYQPAIDSLAQACQPSYALTTSPLKLGAAAGAGGEAAAAIVAGTSLGYTVVVPDYEGPNHEWTAGIEAGRGTLDATRAAESFAPLSLPGSATKVGILGYSGGSQASEFAAELAPTYAPELNIVGAAIGGLPVNIAHIAANVNGGVYSGVFLAAAFGISRAYPQIDIDSLLNDAGKKLEQDISGMCITEFIPRYAFQKIEKFTVGGVDPLTLPAIQDAARADEMGVVGTPQIPMHVYMAVNDGLVLTPDVDTLVSRYCAAGEAIEYVKLPIAEHISGALEGLPGALSYIQGRFAGKPAPSTC